MEVDFRVTSKPIKTLNTGAWKVENSAWCCGDLPKEDSVHAHVLCVCVLCVCVWCVCVCVCVNGRQTDR